jgi:hypothetical protein
MKCAERTISRISTHHFPSSGGHGTEMADRVRQVFPKAQLYIARLNVLPGNDGGNLTITARSAAEVRYTFILLFLLQRLMDRPSRRSNGQLQKRLILSP